MLCVDELASSEEILKYIKTKLNKDNEISMTKKKEKAIYYYRLAADQGDEDAINRLKELGEY